MSDMDVQGIKDGMVSVFANASARFAKPNTIPNFVNRLENLPTLPLEEVT